MNKSILGVILAVISLIAVSVLVFSSRNNDGNPATGGTESNTTPAQNHDSNSPRDDQSEDVSLQSNMVDIEDFAFKPNNIKVKKGTTVTWTNRDSSKHDVKPEDESAKFKGSELLSKGQSYSFTFNDVGIYKYYCSPHPYMKGTVEVVE